MKNYTFIVLILISILFNACSSDSEPSNPHLRNKTYIEDSDIINIAIPKDTFDFEEFKVVEGDIMIPKKRLEIKQDQVKQYSWLNDSLVSQDNIQNVTIYVDNSIPSSGPDNWRDAVQEATNLWNNLNFSGSFSEVNISYSNEPNSDIIVRSDFNQLGNNTIAMGSIPMDCNVGTTIIINLDFYNNYNVPYSTKVYNMVHEIGHNIGFGHTNSPNDWYLKKIIGTPNTDPNSVMNGGTALNSWNGFSTYDKKATLWLYNDNAIYYPEEDDELVSGNGSWALSWKSYYFCQEDNINIKVYYQQFNSENEILRIDENINNTGKWNYPNNLFGGANNDNDGDFRVIITSLTDPNNSHEVNFNMFVD